MSLPALLKTISSPQHSHPMNENPPWKCKCQRHHTPPLHSHVARACPSSHQTSHRHDLCIRWWFLPSFWCSFWVLGYSFRCCPIFFFFSLLCFSILTERRKRLLFFLNRSLVYILKLFPNRMA